MTGRAVDGKPALKPTLAKVAGKALVSSKPSPPVDIWHPVAPLSSR